MAPSSKKPRTEIEDSPKEGSSIPNLSAKCSLTWWFKNVKIGLEKNNIRLNLFRQSQFSFLLDIPSFRYIGAVAHSLFLRHKGEVGDLVFEIKGKLLKFTEMDFALITGLKTGDLTMPKVSSSKKSIREKYLKKQHPILKKHLSDVFDRIVDSNRHEEVVKVALLMCVEWFVRGTDDKYYCKSEFIDLVDSLEEFNKYPWGSLAFQTMTQGVLAAANASRLGEKTYNVYGCIFPLQIWAVERVPTLRESVVSFVPSQIPRFSQYRGWKGWRYNTIYDIFESEGTNIILSLEPTREELESEAVRLVWERFQGIEAGFIERSREVQKKRAVNVQEDVDDDEEEEDEEDEDDEEDMGGEGEGEGEGEEKGRVELGEELKEVREGLKKEREELKKEREELKKEREGLKKEREELRGERKELKKEREELKKERLEMKGETEELKKEREGEKERKKLGEGLDKDEDDEDEGEEGEGNQGKLSKSRKELKKNLGRSNGLNESVAGDDDDDGDKDAPKEKPADNSPSKPAPAGPSRGIPQSKSSKAKRKSSSDDSKAANGAPSKKAKADNDSKPSVKDVPTFPSKSSVPQKGSSTSSRTGATPSPEPVTEDEIRALMLQMAPVTVQDLVAKFRARLKAPQDKTAFAEILKKISKIQKTNDGPSYVVLRDR